MNDFNKAETVERSARVTDEDFALTWIEMINAGHTVQNVADKLHMKKSYAQARSTVIRKALRTASPPFELPFARRETKKKDYNSLSVKLNRALNEIS